MRVLYVYFVTTLLYFLTMGTTLYGDTEDPFVADILTPYKDYYRTKRTHRFVRDCQPIERGNTTHEIFNVSRLLNPEKPFENQRFYHFSCSSGSRCRGQRFPITVFFCFLRRQLVFKIIDLSNTMAVRLRIFDKLVLFSSGSLRGDCYAFKVSKFYEPRSCYPNDFCFLGNPCGICHNFIFLTQAEFCYHICHVLGDFFMLLSNILLFLYDTCRI